MLERDPSDTAVHCSSHVRAVVIIDLPRSYGHTVCCYHHRWTHVGAGYGSIRTRIFASAGAKSVTSSIGKRTSCGTISYLNATRVSMRWSSPTQNWKD